MGWEWLRPFAKGSAKGTDNEVKPNNKFISDVLAGRPIFSLPMETGGFRLRYGRSRLAGLGYYFPSPCYDDRFNRDS